MLFAGSRNPTLPVRVLALGMLLGIPWACVRAKEPTRTTGPWDLDHLRQPPRITVAEQGTTVTALYYEGEPYHGKPTRVFAYLARPEKVRGRVPGLVLVHGGGGTAFRPWAELWAKRGYVALAMDLSGRGPDGKRLADGGPAQDDGTKFADVPPWDAWTYHAVAAVIRGVSLLAARDDVDPKRLGTTGISWGGYLTCIVAGLDQRLKVAVPFYGCGFLHENSAWLPTLQKMAAARRRRWVAAFDPSRYLAQARMPVLFVNGTGSDERSSNSFRRSASSASLSWGQNSSAWAKRDAPPFGWGLALRRRASRPG